MDNDNLRYKIVLAFYTPKYEKEWSVVDRLIIRATELLTRYRDYNRCYVHVDVIDMIGYRYGPVNGDVLFPDIKTFSNTGYSAFLKINMNRSDYKAVMKFILSECVQKPGFDMAGLLNFVPFLPTYFCPIDNSISGFCSSKKWYCSAFAMTALQKIERLKKSGNVFIQRLMGMRPCQTSAMDIYHLLYSSEGEATLTDNPGAKSLNDADIMAHRSVFQEIHKELGDYDVLRDVQREVDTLV